MNPEDASNEFHTRLYLWTERDLHRELEEGCPLLKPFGTYQRHFLAFAQWSESLAPIQREKLSIALAKGAHPNAVRMLGRELTEEDRQWLGAIYNETTPLLHRLPPLLSADSTRPGFQPFDQRACIPQLKQALSADLGTVVRESKKKIVCQRLFDDWEVETEFWMEKRGNNGNVFCEHEIRRESNAQGDASAIFRKNLLQSYGLYSSTMVHIASAVECEPAVIAIATLARHFVINMKPLLAGLGIHD